MKLFDFAFSPNCRKVRAVAYELGVDSALFERARPLETGSHLGRRSRRERAVLSVEVQ